MNATASGTSCMPSFVIEPSGGALLQTCMDLRLADDWAAYGRQHGGAGPIHRPQTQKRGPYGSI